MSRGFGQMPRKLLAAIERHGKPMTFWEMRAALLPQNDGLEPDVRLLRSFDRSASRALHRLVSQNVLIVIGRGGRAGPFRYFLHPMVIAELSDTEVRDALFDVLKEAPRRKRSVEYNTECPCMTDRWRATGARGTVPATCLSIQPRQVYGLVTVASAITAAPTPGGSTAGW